jgi:hypothetical protein
MVMISHLKPSRSGLARFVSSALAVGLLVPALIGSLGCAQAESRNWAQTSPLIEPEVRADPNFHLGAHGDPMHASDEDLIDHSVD